MGGEETFGIVCRNGRYSNALELLLEMKRYGLRPDKFAYTSLLCAGAQVADDVSELLYDMQACGVSAYQAAMQSLTAAKR